MGEAVQARREARETAGRLPVAVGAFKRRVRETEVLGAAASLLQRLADPL